VFTFALLLSISIECIAHPQQNDLPQASATVTQPHKHRSPSTSTVSITKPLLVVATPTVTATQTSGNTPIVPSSPSPSNDIPIVQAPPPLNGNPFLIDATSTTSADKSSKTAAAAESSNQEDKDFEKHFESPAVNRRLGTTALVCIIVIPTVVLGIGIALAINAYVRQRRRRHRGKGSSYSTGDGTFSTKEMSRSGTGQSGQQQPERRRRIFRGGSLDLRRSSAVTRSVGRSGLPQNWSGRSMSFSNAIANPERIKPTADRPVAVPAPAMLETGKASGVLSDASAFPPVPGPSRTLESRARAGLTENRAHTNRWTVTLDTSDMQVVPLPPPNYKEALREPPAATES
ncbi:hypothetical protein BDF19DRAFT_432547, partial [Syncephalis fuscata]